MSRFVKRPHFNNRGRPANRYPYERILETRGTGLAYPVPMPRGSVHTARVVIGSWAQNRCLQLHTQWDRERQALLVWVD